jgi:hypothetical protein
MTRGRQPLCGTIWDWDKSPEIPSLSNGVNAASPPLVVVGGITVIGKREAFWLLTSQNPVVP